MVLKQSTCMLKFFQLICLLLCIDHSLSDFNLFGLKFAILNISSISFGDSRVKNTILADTVLWKIIYGQNSPTNTINGKLVLVKSSENKIISISNKTNGTIEFIPDNYGCSNYLNENLPENFIAVVRRGGCPFEDKIKIAYNNKAIAIIIFNYEPNVFTMLTRENSIVNVFVSSYVARILLQSMENSEAFVTIEPNFFEINDIKGSFPSRASVYFVFVSFFFVIIISLSWIVVFYIQKFRCANAKKRLEKKLKKATTKALTKMPIRKLKADDKELLDVCIICLENYGANDAIRELPCNHIFHQNEIDLWLYDNRNCPMCKIDILQAYGIEIKKAEGFLQKILDRLLRSSSSDQLNNNRTHENANSLNNNDLETNRNINPTFGSNENINQAFNQTDEIIELSIQNNVVNQTTQAQVTSVNNLNENINVTTSETVHNQSSQNMKDNTIQA